MKKTKDNNRFKNYPTSDLVLMYVAIDTSHYWTDEDGFPRKLNILVKDPEKDMLRLSKEIETELMKRGIYYKNLR